MNKRIGTGGSALAGVAMLGLSLGILFSGQRQAQAALDADVNDAVIKIGQLIKKGDMAAAKAQAAAVAKKYDIEEIMAALKPRSKGGIGVGKVKGSVIPDGIELKLQTIARDAPAGTLAKEAEALEEMTYHVAAVAEIAKAKAPTKDSGKKKRADWLNWTKEMQDGATSLNKAVKGGGAQEVKAVADKLNGTCAACHGVFK